MLYRLPSNLDDIVDKWVEDHPLNPVVATDLKTMNPSMTNSGSSTNGGKTHIKNDNKHE